MAVANVAEVGAIAVCQFWWRNPAAASRGTLALGDSEVGVLRMEVHLASFWSW